MSLRVSVEIVCSFPPVFKQIFDHFVKMARIKRNIFVHGYIIINVMSELVKTTIMATATVFGSHFGFY